MRRNIKTKIGDVWGVYEVIGIYKEVPEFYSSVFRVKCQLCGREFLKSGRVLIEKPKYCQRCSRTNKGNRVSKNFTKGMIVGKYQVLSESCSGMIEVKCLLCGWKGRIALSTLRASKNYKNTFCLHKNENGEREYAANNKEDRYFDIFFSDLNEDAQKRLMDAIGIKDPSEMNWDIDMCPIALYPIPYNVDIIAAEVGEVVK